MKNNNQSGSVRWNGWSDDAFDLAKNEGKLVLLDLTASWCHWCHEMDRNTYDNPEIAKTINDKFVPVRVDIDRRPDISERYNRGGFPTTAFLSERGESVWGATYVPPADMKRIMESILRAKEGGEIDRALERCRKQPLDVLKNARARVPADAEQLSGIFEDIFSAYDVEYGGFGIEPKFPHPDVLELLLIKYAETKDDELADAVVNTLEHMASGLHDKVEGGVFRYSVTRDWQTPHYEKMLETNVGFLRNLVQAFGIVGNHGFDVQARDIAKYAMTRLRDSKSGGFYGSQDADEEYYKLPANARRKRKVPTVDKTVYAGWNAEASAVFTMAGTVLGDEEMLRAGMSSWAYALEHLWNPRLSLVRHLASSEIYLFEDQVSSFKALLAQLGLSKDDAKIKLAEELIRGVNNAFASADGGFNDVMKGGEAIGELDTPRRPLVENSNWALALAQFGSLVQRQELVNQARNILNSFTQHETEAHGVFAAAYLRARWALDNGMVVVEIHARTEEQAHRSGLRSSAQMLFDPSTVQTTIADNSSMEPYAVVCAGKTCSKKINDPDELLMLLRTMVEGRKLPLDTSGGIAARAGFRID
jgi:uncharacterized protein YyaL (SSP411 family)